jgi:cobaltochelatase CobN
MILPVTTKRQVLGHIFVCNGCCCGRTEKGHPPVPLDWLKAEFKSRKLIRNVHLTIAGCLGPCDASNVVGILTAERGMRWYGGLSEFWQYESLMDWASATKAAQCELALPSWLAEYELDPFAAARAGEPAALGAIA